MSKIDDIAKDFKSVLEWRHYCEAQFRTITELNKSMHGLEVENQQLKKLLEQYDPSLTTSKITNLFEQKAEDLLSAGNSIGEVICHLEIEKIKEIALKRELSMEEVKKFEIIVKSLSSLKSQPATRKQQEISKIKTEDLLKVIDGGFGKETS